MSKLQIRNSLLLLLTATIWGMGFVAQSVGLDYVGVFTFTCVRSWIAGIVLIPCIWFLNKFNKKPEAGISHEGNELGSQNEKAGVQNQKTAVENKNSEMLIAERKTLVLGGICCGIFLAIASSLQQIGVQYTTVGKAGFITALYIVIVPVLGLFFKKKCTPFVWIGVAFAVAGLYCLCFTSDYTTSGQLIQKGDFYLFLCALAFSGHILCIDYFSEKTDGVKMACIQFFVCGIITAVPMLLIEQPSMTAILSAWQPLLYAGAMSSGVGYTLQIVGQKGMNPTVASLILSLESVVSVLAGLVILGQKLSSRETLGCVLMFCAIILAQLPEKKKEIEFKK